MQNFTECARRHTISKKLLKPVLRCNTGRQSDLNRMFMNTGARTCVGRLLVPVPIHNYQAVCKDQSVIKALRPTFIQHHNSLGLPGLYRFFNTTALFCADRQVKKDFDKKPEENKDQSDKDKKSDKDDKDKDNKKFEEALPVLIHLSLLTSTGIILYYVMNGLSDAEKMEIVHTTSWNEFVHQMLMKGEVQKIIINVDSNIVKIVLQNNAVVNNKKTTLKTMYLVVPDLAKTEERIREAEDKLGIPYHERVPIVFERTLERHKHIVNTIYGLGMLFLILGIASKSKNIMKDINILKPFFPKYTVTEPTTGKGIRFSDVAGLKEAKVEVMEFVDYLQQPERYRTLGAKMPKGVLLLGPPGCGKTMLAKAVATESNVPFLSMNGCEFIEMYGGLGAARVRDLFKEAKKRAPCIIYIDEIDAVGQVRATNSQNGNNESERTLVQLLVEMDGMGTQQDIVILASTNRAEVLDKALLRRGRFDRHILIDLPTQHERKEIFEKHLGTLSLEKPPPDYSAYLASVTPGFTGADIANVCNEAALHAARFEKTKISGQDLMYAIERARNGPAKITNAMSDVERKIVAYREAGYALLTWLLKNTDPVAKVTIVPTTSGSLGHTQILEGLSYIVPVSKIEDLTCATLGSRITETLVFGYSTDGTKHYLKTVTDLVTKQVAQYGLSPAVGLLGFEPDKYKKEGRPFSKKLDSIIDAEVRRIILEASKRAEKLLLKNRRLLNALAEELLKKDTLYYEDIEKLIGAPPYPKKRPQIPAGFMENTATAINQKY